MRRTARVGGDESGPIGVDSSIWNSIGLTMLLQIARTFRAKGESPIWTGEGA
jgi:hypothetical protein